MNNNLFLYDMTNFLNKYTRFMTKNIYISSKLYTNFLEQYSYLYQKLDKERFLYENNKQYQQTMNIYHNQNQLIKLHNQKYLKQALKTNQDFFNNLDEELNLTTKDKLIVLSEEENTYIVSPKNKLNLSVAKIYYLLRNNNYNPHNIFILTTTKEEKDYISSLNIDNNTPLSISTLKEYHKTILKGQPFLDNKQKYNIISNYIINDLFKQKDNFNSFYQSFSKYIYLNKDYKDYETFKDYHNYMYKRKYLASNLSLKKFNNQEIKTRKKYLRTIKDETLENSALVDIANLLTLNSISYTYNYELQTFKINNGIPIYIKYLDKEESNIKTTTNNIIYLYKTYKEKKNYLEVLIYELIKRRYPLELLDEEELYNQLKITNIDNYFSEFIYKYLIPLINRYEETNNLDNTRLNNNAKKEFLQLYDQYTKLVKESNLITEKELLAKMEQDIKLKKYKYLILLDDIPLNCNIPTMTIVDHYEKTELLKENIKLLYDYKKYLAQNQIIPIPDTYLNKEEVAKLTNNFIKDNLLLINKHLKETTKRIDIYEYSDSNRLHIYQNISNTCYEALNNYPKNTLIGLREMKDINILVNKDNFIKQDKNTLISKNKTKIKVEEIKKITKPYNTIILPYLILDSYHDTLFTDDYQYNIKLMIYIAINKCKNNIIILCPTSKKTSLLNLLEKINN